MKDGSEEPWPMRVAGLVKGGSVDPLLKRGAGLVKGWICGGIGSMGSRTGVYW